MNREDAEHRAAELNREHPDRHTARWVARERDHVWEDDPNTLQDGMRNDQVNETVEAKHNPPQPLETRPE